MKSVKIPWGAWYGDTSCKLTFPDYWNVTVAAMSDAPEIGDEQINRSFDHPIGAETIYETARGKKSAAIIVDDISRPTPAHRLLPIIVDELKRAGVRENLIYIILSLGAHRAMTRDDMMKKLGERIVNKIMIYNHDPYENLVNLGKTEMGTPVKVNKYFVKAEVKIAVGCIMPHGLAGFGGGGKSIVPGIAGIDTIEMHHKPYFLGLKGYEIGRVEGNELRYDIEDVARKAGLELIVNVVVNSTRGIAGVFVGDVVKAHREGVRLARKVCETCVPRGADIAIFNAYPKDTELTQVSSALNVWSRSDWGVVKKKGYMVFTTFSPEGRGYHHLAYGKAYRKINEGVKLKKEIFEDRRAVVFSPNLILSDVLHRFPEGTLLFRDWSDLIHELEKKYGARTDVIVFPCGALQLGLM